MTNTIMTMARIPTKRLSVGEQGLYAVNFGGGQVDITSGIVSRHRSLLIENGKIGAPVKGATLIAMDGCTHQVKMIAMTWPRQWRRHLRQGRASVPVGVGQPTLRVDGLTVGGHRHDRAYRFYHPLYAGFSASCWSASWRVTKLRTKYENHKMRDAGHNELTAAVRARIISSSTCPWRCC